MAYTREYEGVTYHRYRVRWTSPTGRTGAFDVWSPGRPWLADAVRSALREHDVPDRSNVEVIAYPLPRAQSARRRVALERSLRAQPLLIEAASLVDEAYQYGLRHALYASDYDHIHALLFEAASRWNVAADALEEAGRKQDARRLQNLARTAQLGTRRAMSVTDRVLMMDAHGRLFRSPTLKG